MAPKKKGAPQPTEKPAGKAEEKPKDKPAGKAEEKPKDKPAGTPPSKTELGPSPDVVLTNKMKVFWVVILAAIIACIVAIILLSSKYKKVKGFKSPFDAPFQRLGASMAASLGKPELKHASPPDLATAVEDLPNTVQGEHDDFNAKKEKYKNLLYKTARSSSSPWKLHGRSLYYFSEGAKTWYDAENFCISRDAHLASILNDEEQNFIGSLLQRASWIGLTVENDAGIWGWSDGSQLTTQYWSEGRPNNTELFGESRQDCTMMAPSLAVRNWKDESCHKSYGWICKENLDLDEP